MKNIDKASRAIVAPATLKLGDTDATEITQIMHGSFTYDAPSLAAAASSSASASISGLSASFSVFVVPRAMLGPEAGGVVVQAVVGAANAIFMTTVNASTATRDAASTTFSYFAIR